MALRQGEIGTPVAEIVRKLGISEQTYYRWKKKYGGLGVSELRELKAIREENRRLKTLVADLSLDKTILQEVLKKKVVSPAQRRAAVAWARRAYRLPERRACRALGACPLTVRYQSVQAPREPLRARLRELAAVRVSYGYRATAHLATPRGLAGESEAHRASVPRRRPYVEAEKAQTTAECGTARAGRPGDSDQRALGDGLRA